MTAADPGREFSFAVGNPNRPQTRWRYRFEPEGEATLVTEEFEIVRRPGPIGRLMTKLGTGVAWSDRVADLEKGIRQTLERLKAVAEQGG